MALYEYLEGIPAGVERGGPAMLNRIDVADKLSRNKGLNFKEEAEFSGICENGTLQLIRCYGNSYYGSAAEYSRQDFFVMCKNCPYFIGRDRGKQTSYSIADPYFIDHEFERFLDYESKTPECFVYFISDGEYVKIGVSNNIKQRLSELQTSNARKLEIVALIPAKNRQAAYKMEEQLHWCYTRFLVRGEWYNILKIIDTDKFMNRFSPDDYNVL